MKLIPPQRDSGLRGRYARAGGSEPHSRIGQDLTQKLKELSDKCTEVANELLRGKYDGQAGEITHRLAEVGKLVDQWIDTAVEDVKP